MQQMNQDLDDYLCGELDFSLLKTDAKQQLKALFGKYDGSKTVIWEQSLTGRLGLLCRYSFLKELGVERMLALGSKVDVTTRHVFYFIRPDPALIASIRETLTPEAASRHNQHHLIYIPRESFISKKLLEDQQLLSLFRTIETYPVQLYPMDNDVISLEFEKFFYQTMVCDDCSGLYDVALALVHLQKLYGVIPQVYAIGKASKAIYARMEKMQKALKADHTYTQKSSKVDSIILLDRSIDYITPMLTQLTYEGIIDEFFGIQNNKLKVPAQKFMQKSSQQLSQQPQPAQETADVSTADKKMKELELNSRDLLYSSWRDQNIATLLTITRNSALKDYQDKLRWIKEENKKKLEPQMMNVFMKELKSLEAGRVPLENHYTLTDLIYEVSKVDDFKRGLNTEEEFTVFQKTDKVHPHIEDLIARSAPLTKVLRLICLQTLVNNGIRAKNLEYYKKEILQTYGFHHLINLNNLEKAGLLRSTSDSSKAYSTLRKQFRLTPEHVDLENPQDIAYAYGNYAPLSVRIAQMIVNQGWRPVLDSLKQLNEPLLEAKQETCNEAQVAAITSEKKRLVLAFFVGGCTHAEIASLRFLSRQKDSNTDFIVGTTKLINGSTLIESTLENH